MDKDRNRSTNGSTAKQKPNYKKKRAYSASAASNTPNNTSNNRFPNKKRRNSGSRNAAKKTGGKRNNGTKSASTWSPNSYPPLGDNIRIIPLGGVEEIGKNMTVVEYGDDIVIIDAGVEFGDEDTPGIDYIIPNIKYLEENRNKIRALVITHGHLDHIGSIPYIMKNLGNPPIYTREFGAYLIQKKQQEFPHLPKLNIQMISEGDGAIKLSDNLRLNFFGLTHAIPDSSGIILETPYGDIVATGDVRVNNDEGKPTEEEIRQYSVFKDRNILLLMMDSTGIEKPGWSLSEDKVVENVDRIVSQLSGRVVIATFASQVDRIISFIEIAAKYNKKVVFEGRSMKTNMEIVLQLGLTDLSHVIPVEEASDYPPNQIMIIATGAQGEEFAAIMRMSNKSHKHIRLDKTDTIILSSSVIPGNERAVNKLKDNLYRNDPRVITYLDSDVHASGHGKRAELEWIHKQIPYKFFMPVHGHHFMLKMHAELAESLGAPRSNIVIPDNGSIIEIADRGQKIVDRQVKVPAEDMTVEGSQVSDVQNVVLQDRKLLAEDGMFVIIASIDLKTGKLKKSPDIISRGFIYLRESQDLLQQTRLLIKKTIEDTTRDMRPINFDLIKSEVSDQIGKFLLQQTAKRPIIIPVILGTS